jgi:hypothetical protein
LQSLTGLTVDLRDARQHISGVELRIRGTNGLKDSAVPSLFFGKKRTQSPVGAHKMQRKIDR